MNALLLKFPTSYLPKFVSNSLDCTCTSLNCRFLAFIIRLVFNIIILYCLKSQYKPFLNVFYFKSVYPIPLQVPLLYLQLFQAFFYLNLNPIILILYNMRNCIHF